MARIGLHNSNDCYDSDMPTVVYGFRRGDLLNACKCAIALFILMNVPASGQASTLSHKSDVCQRQSGEDRPERKRVKNQNPRQAVAIRKTVKPFKRRISAVRSALYWSAANLCQCQHKAFPKQSATGTPDRRSAHVFPCRCVDQCHM